MISLYLGLVAALCWGVHDLCIRLVASRMKVELALLTVLVSGLLVLAPFAITKGDWASMTQTGFAISAAAGVSYVSGLYAVYRAFAIGPVRLVAPIVGAYPILSMCWAAAQGRMPSFDQIAAVLVIVLGVGLIAALSDEGGHGQANADTAAKASSAKRSAILWSIGGAVGFPVTFALGNLAVEHGSELPVTLMTRASASLALFSAMLLARTKPQLAGVPWKTLMLMGVLDVTAMGSVQAAARYPNPEFAAVAASIFGMLTIILAWAFLKEKMTPGQWGAAALVFAGIGYLGH